MATFKGDIREPPIKLLIQVKQIADLSTHTKNNSRTRTRTAKYICFALEFHGQFHSALKYINAGQFANIN